MAYIVTGGHSPIALAITKRLCDQNKVYHVTRKIDDKLQNEVSNYSNVVLEEWDLSDTLRCISNLEHKLNQEKVDGIIFAHRYRDHQKNFTIQFVTEVETPFELVKLYCNYSGFQNGSVVFLSSPAASSIVSDQDFIYHACKAAISQLVKFAAINFRATGKRVNGISPGGFIIKDRSTKFYEANDKITGLINNFVPLGRMGQVDDIASVVKFLCGEEASYINGQIVTVDGGYSGMEPSYNLLDNKFNLDK